MSSGPPTADVSIWDTIQRQAVAAAKAEPILAAWLHEAVLNHINFEQSLSHLIAKATRGSRNDQALIRQTAERIYCDDPSLIDIAIRDLNAPRQRDPACCGPLHVLLHFKGYIALEAYRISNRLWQRRQFELAKRLHHSITHALHVSIHPSATIGDALFIDHGTGVTVGRDVVIEQDVSMLQEVTLGSLLDGSVGAPRIGRGVLLSAGATVLGNVEIGDFAKIGAGSLVLTSIPSGCTAVGVPARLAGRTPDPQPALSMEQSLP